MHFSWFHHGFISLVYALMGLPLAMKLDESYWLFRVDLHHPIAGRGRHSLSRFRLRPQRPPGCHLQTGLLSDHAAQPHLTPRPMAAIHLLLVVTCGDIHLEHPMLSDYQGAVGGVRN